MCTVLNLDYVHCTCKQLHVRILLKTSEHTGINTYLEFNTKSIQLHTKLPAKINIHLVINSLYYKSPITQKKFKEGAFFSAIHNTQSKVKVWVF